MSNRYPGEDLDDAADRLYEEHVQELLDAKAEGYEAGLKDQRVETNPYSLNSPLHTRWLDAWREGIWAKAKRRAA